MICDAIRKLFRRGRPNSTAGSANGWEIDAPHDFAAFLRALPGLFGADSLLYLEGAEPTPEILAFLREHETGEKTRISGGTLFPKPNVFYIPITMDNMEGLAALSEPDCGIPTHVHVRGTEGVALEWYDASAGDPILVRASVDPDRIDAFCERVGSGNRRRT